MSTLKRQKLTVLAPIAVIGDKVPCHNYLVKRKNKMGNMEDSNTWEIGKVTKAILVAKYNGDFSWMYDVLLDRRSKPRVKYGRDHGSNTVSLRHLSDDQIKKL